MPPKLTRVDTLTTPDWNDRLDAEDSCALFRSSEWARVLCDSYGYRPHYLVDSGSGGRGALLPFMEIDSVLTGRRGGSLPFSDHVDPVIGAYAESRRWRYLDFHGGCNLLPETQPSLQFVGHRLSLAKVDVQDLSHLHASTRRNIRKAMRLGVEVETSTSQEALDVFYRLHCLTRKRHQLPAQPFRFFQNIHDGLLSQGLGHIVRAVHEGKTVAAVVFLHFGDHVLFKFGASDLGPSARPHERHRVLGGHPLVQGTWFPDARFRSHRPRECWASAFQIRLGERGVSDPVLQVRYADQGSRQGRITRTGSHYAVVFQSDADSYVTSDR
jgi:hypothetical protein